MFNRFSGLRGDVFQSGSLRTPIDRGEDSPKSRFLGTFAANRGLLYIDEVNLLDDHVVDVLLDSAAMGVNTVEREGISFAHPARFILVGTMNPEEGDLRPQLLDRFALSVNIAGINNTRDRVAIIERNLKFESDSEAFIKEWGQRRTERPGSPFCSPLLHVIFHFAGRPHLCPGTLQFF